MKSLVLARVGRNSLHRCWIGPGKPRDWDLHLCPLQEIEPPTDLDCIVSDVIPGAKWTGLRRLLNAWDGWRAYDYIWRESYAKIILSDFRGWAASASIMVVMIESQA